MAPERLTTRILLPHDPSPSTEDIFASALDTLFTDDTQQSHGVPGQAVIYRSPRYGDVYLQIPVHPEGDVGRKLFAHYLWNAGLVAAEGIERASCDDDDGGDEAQRIGFREDTGNSNDEAPQRMQWDRKYWDVRGLDVLEIGAATALPSLISALSNARTVVSTDHPSSPAITMDTIGTNLKINITNRGTHVQGLNKNKIAQEREFLVDQIPVLNHPPVHTETETMVCGYTWGTEQFYDPHGYGRLVEKQPRLKTFDRIVIADCLWMPDQHENIVKTVLLYLKEAEQHTNTQRMADVRVPCAIVVAGFHTGREIVNDFLQVATSRTFKSNAGLKAIDVSEVDIDGNRRPWQPARPNETREQSRKWCMCAILVRNSS